MRKGASWRFREVEQGILPGEKGKIQAGGFLKSLGDGL